MSRPQKENLVWTAILAAVGLLIFLGVSTPALSHHVPIGTQGSTKAFCWNLESLAKILPSLTRDNRAKYFQLMADRSIRCVDSRIFSPPDTDMGINIISDELYSSHPVYGGPGCIEIYWARDWPDEENETDEMVLIWVYDPNSKDCGHGS